VLASGGVAAAAEQQTLEVVLVDPVTGAALAADVEDLLHPFPQRQRDQRFVPAGERLAVVLDDADVVGVAQHMVQLVSDTGCSGR
jgi:hypothetical protein